MLSPSISTNSKGNTDRDAVSRSPTWYCALSPVPLSPITAKRSDFSARGASVPPAAPAGAAAWLTAARADIGAGEVISGSAPMSSASRSAGGHWKRGTRVDMVWPQPAIFGTMSRATSTMMLAATSRSTMWWPTMRYSSSGGSSGSFCRSWAGKVLSGLSVG